MTGLDVNKKEPLYSNLYKLAICSHICANKSLKFYFAGLNMRVSENKSLKFYFCRNAFKTLIIEYLENCKRASALIFF